MSNPLKTKQFQKLKKKWYNELTKSGFKDIENSDGFLKDYHSIRFQEKYSPETFKENERYWQLALQLLNDYPFIIKIEIKMWKIYVDGKDFRTIAQETHMSVAAVSRKVQFSI
jgi:hypothetical protein